jgi:hypothetical protein
MLMRDRKKQVYNDQEDDCGDENFDVSQCMRILGSGVPTPWFVPAMARQS